MANDVEITLESNPASADAARFADYRAAGVNRLSLGVQALNDADLKMLGRLHDVAEAKAALKLAHEEFRPRLARSDLCAARSDASQRGATKLKEALAFGTEHLSLYQLTIEPATPFATLHRTGALTIPDDDRAAALYETTQEMTRSRRPSRPTRSPTMRARARRRGTIFSTGATAPMPASVPARMAGSISDGKRIATSDRAPARTLARDRRARRPRPHRAKRDRARRRRARTSADEPAPRRRARPRRLSRALGNGA